MGACLGRDQKTNSNPINAERQNENVAINTTSSSSPSLPETQVPGTVLEVEHNLIYDWLDPESRILDRPGSNNVKLEIISRQNIDQLVLKTLAVIRLLVDK